MRHKICNSPLLVDCKKKKKKMLLSVVSLDYKGLLILSGFKLYQIRYPS